MDKRDQVTERKRAEEALKEHKEHLEALVEERTSELQREITERKRVEESLRVSETKIRALLDQTFQFIGLMTLDGTLIEASKAALEFAGIDEADVIGKPFWETPWWTRSTELQKQLQDATSKAAEGEFMRLEATHLAADGNLHYIDFSLKPVKDEKGNVIYLIPEGRDITERKWAEDELRKHREHLEKMVEERTSELQREITERKQAEETLLRLERAVEQSIDGIAVSDLEGNIQFVNPAWAQMHGYSPEELPGKHLSIFHTEEQLQEDVTPFNERVMEAGAHQGEVGHVRKDGATFPTWMTTTLLRDETGNPAGLVGTARDITERKRLEQAIRESLEHRGRQVQTSTEVAQEVSAAPALDELYRRVVTLIKERFGYYYAQIFRHDPERNTMVMVEGYGEVGEKMKAAGHNLPYGRGTVGTAAATGEPVLASDVSQDPHWVPHPDLPNTKGELAVPIKWRDKVLGLLDVQSDEVGALTEEDQVMLLGLAGQIASAIESTNLFEQTQARARREQALREITASVRGLSDTESIVRTAVRELGTALGRPTFIRLGSAEELSEAPIEMDGGDGKTT